MEVLILKFGIDGSVNQATLMDLLRSKGDEVIQISQGLCLKTKDTEEAIKNFLAVKGLPNITVLSVEKNDTTLSPDILSFIND